MVDRQKKFTDQFIKSINLHVNQMPKELVSKTIRAITLEALRRIVLRTPVDTGRARGNWQVDINDASDLILLQKFDKAGTQTILDGLSQIANLKNNPFVKVFITNNLPYIVRLEDGHSKQAPPGTILALTFEELAEIFK